MLGLLAHPVFARMYAAQVVALAGTGLLTVALGLLAYDLAGQQAGVVLGTAYAIKMIAYVGLAPLAAALVARLPRRAVLIAADLVRAGAALALPFVQTEWQIYGLIFLLQAASATFTPTFQAAIPDILPDEAQYTRALSLSRLAYDLENLASPALAAALLSVVSYSNLFAGTVAGFLVSACLVASTSLPHNKPQVAAASFRSRLTRGTFIYLSTPRLRGLLALTFTAAAASGFVLVNTVVIVRQGFGFDDRAVALAMAAYGVGSMLAALALPQVLQRLPDRPVMLAASFGLVLLMLGTGLWMAVGSNGPGWSAMLGLWAALGLAYSAILTPAGRLLRRSSRSDDRPAVFAAQFALSHLCWLVTYPVAGWGGQVLGLGWVLVVLALSAAIATAAALRLWPAQSSAPLTHSHENLPPDHPHLQAHGAGRGPHAHPIIIDDHHRYWPR